MPNLIRRLTHRLTLLLGPGTGTHRATAPRHLNRPTPTRTAQPSAPPCLPLPHSPYCIHLPLDGTDSRLVRPYLTGCVEGGAA
ncbi:hypothetical protein ACLGIH_17715 [Streptomyces sp. HMX87]|uniref:hypothetical protein n=1 Tax=Streptomyces sp. HMX87 TaxID=3390849 RepID=UPI003A8C1E02